jgi:hypothetical protein
VWGRKAVEVHSKNVILYLYKSMHATVRYLSRVLMAKAACVTGNTIFWRNFATYPFKLSVRGGFSKLQARESCRLKKDAGNWKHS